MVTRITLYIAAALLIAAHFLRMGNIIAVALCLAAPLLFLVRRYWSLLLLQGLAYVAGVIWLATAWQIVSMRMALGQPWLRAAAILVVVAAITALAGVLLHGRSLQLRYRAR